MKVGCTVSSSERFSQKHQAKTRLVNMWMTEPEIMRIEVLVKMLNLPGGRAGVLRLAIDQLMDGLPAATKLRIDEVIAAFEAERST